MTRPSACWRLRELGLPCTSADGHAAHGASWRDTVPGEARALAVADRLLSALPGECRPLGSPRDRWPFVQGLAATTRARARAQDAPFLIPRLRLVRCCYLAGRLVVLRAVAAAQRALPPGAAACRGPRRQACARAARGPRCRTRLAAASPAALPVAACM